MSLHLSFCGNLCDTVNIKDCLSCLPCFEHNNKKLNDHNCLIDEINDITKIMKINPTKEIVCATILNKLLEMTDSQFGIIGKVKKDNIEIYSVTNLAWNFCSKNFFIKYNNYNIIFKSDDNIFKQIQDSQESVILNHYDRHDLLPEGHVNIKRFLGIPTIIGGNVTMIIGLCNKKEKYKDKDIKKIINIINMMSFLFFDLDNL